MGTDKASKRGAAIAWHYAEENGWGDLLKIDPDDHRAMLADMIADLLHYAAAVGVSTAPSSRAVRAVPPFPGT